jgi:hypothetical protein
MTRFGSRIRKALVGIMVVGGTVFATVPTDGCSQFEQAFEQGYEYGYNHPEILDQIFGSGSGSDSFSVGTSSYTTSSYPCAT